jgi:hypothetical protein
VIRRLVLAGTIVAGLLFMHAFHAVGISVAKAPTESMALAMPSIPGEMSAPAAASHNDGGAADDGGHDGLHIAGLCLAVLLATGVVVVAWRRRRRPLTAGLRSPIARRLTSHLVRRPKRPPGLADLCVLIC